MDGQLAQKTPTLQNPTVLYYAWDHLGTIRLITNDDLSIQERHDYEPYGLELPPYVNQSANTHQFTGHERDLTSGFDYMHFRYFGSTMGRFCKPDNVNGKLANPQSWNKYSYVVGNPVNFNDPTGHDWALFMHEINQVLAKFGLSAKSGDERKPASDKAKKKVPKKTPDDPVKTALKSEDVGLVNAGASVQGNDHRTIPLIKGKQHSSTKERWGNEIGGAFEMVIGAETLDLGTHLLRIGAVLAFVGTIGSEEIVPAIGIPVGIFTMGVGLSMISGGGYMIYDGGHRIYLAYEGDSKKGKKNE